MSYIDKNEENKTVNDEDIKLVNPLKAIVSEDTIIENPEDIIEQDPDENRKNAFKKAYDRILTIYPEIVEKKKKKKKESEKTFDENLRVKVQEGSVKEIEEKEKEVNSKEKGRERDE